MKRLQIIITLTLLFSITQLTANNVAVSNVSLTTGAVSFDVSWDNSWRINTGPSNYDGVWVFVKFRYCIDRPLNQGGPLQSAPGFRHAWLSTNSGDHSVPAGADFSVETTDIAATPRGMGVFIHRNAVGGPGTINFTNVSLRWDTLAQLISPSSGVDIKVFAIEMVNVPQGSYELGDGGGNSNSRFGTDLTLTTPYTVNSEAAIAVQTAGGLFANGSFTTTATPISANFPKGFDAFWVMKYEVSQGQYVDFLNCLSRVEQDARVQTGVNQLITARPQQFANGINSLSARYGIRVPATFPQFEPIIFGNDFNFNDVFNEAGDGQNIACNFIDRIDHSVFLDWAALRPITELEYEKTCRGSGMLAIPNEYSWGNLVEVRQVVISNSGFNNEVPVPSGNGPVVYNSGIPGPARVGSKQFVGATRIQAGASYYGAADMSGNLEEGVAAVFNNVVRSTFDDTAGDGDIASGLPASWVSNFTGTGSSRGGGYDGTMVTLSVSYRLRSMQNWSSRQGRHGIRGGRR